MVIKDKDFRIVLFISISFFLFSFFYAVKLYYAGVFYQYDIFFDSDIKPNLILFANGWSEGRNTYTHVILEFLYFPVLIIQKCISFFFPHYETQKIRELVALSIAPFFNALTLIVLFYSLKKILKRFDSYIITFIFALSFSNIIYSILPESYALSGFAISLIVYAYLSSERVDTHSKLYWFFLAFLITGVTLTNIIIFFILHYFLLIRFNYGKKIAFIETFKISTQAFLAVLALYFLLRFSIYPEVAEYEGTARWLSNAMRHSYIEYLANFLNLFTASLNSLIAFDPKIIHVQPCEFGFCEKITFIRTKSDIYFILFSLFFFLAIIYLSFLFKCNRDVKFFIYASWCVVIYNFSFHVFFGREMFLYSQHWLIFLFLIIFLPLIRNKMFLLLFAAFQIYYTAAFFFTVNKLWL